MTESNAYKRLKYSYVSCIQSQLKLNKHYKPFVVTVRFKFVPLSSASRLSKYKFFTNDTWSQYAKTYRFVLSQLDKHYQKKSYLFPRTFDFLDVDGSRDNRRACFTEDTIPHVHSIWLVHGQTLGRFETLMDTGFRSVIEHNSNRVYLSSMDARPLTEDLPKVVSYCSKAYDLYQAIPIRDEYPFFNQLPLSECEREALRQERQALPFYTAIESKQETKKRLHSLKV